jgi:hypothetical protein
MVEPHTLPQPVSALMTYVERGQRTEVTYAVLEIILASCHPDFVMSLATARLLSPALRMAIADYLRHVLIHGLDDGQQTFLFNWAQDKMLAAP